MDSGSTTDELEDREVVDARPFVCPNGHGVLDPKNETTVVCGECGYSRQVLAEAEDDELQPGDVVYTNNHTMVRMHDAERVALYVGRDPQSATPAIVDARELADVLTRFLVETEAE